MSWTRSMSPGSRAPRASSTSSEPLTETILAAASAYGCSAVRSGIDLAFATDGSYRLRGELLVRSVVVPVQQGQDDPLAQAALADLQRLAEHLGELLEQQDARGQQSHPPGVELEALGDLGDLVAREDSHRALESLILEHGADQRSQGGGAATHRDRLVRLLELFLLEEVGDVIPKATDLTGRWRI